MDTGSDVASTGSVAWTLEGFEEIEITLDGMEVTVALADTANLRRQGLQGVTDLGRAEGMLFTWGGALTDSGFTMRNTLIDLDIGFFDAGGRLVDVLRMTPCEAEPCPVYRAASRYSYALEIPAGGTLRLSRSTVLAQIP